jgi:hypothetical protein
MPAGEGPPLAAGRSEEIPWTMGAHGHVRSGRELANEREEVRENGRRRAS